MVTEVSDQVGDLTLFQTEPKIYWRRQTRDKSSYTHLLRAGGGAGQCKSRLGQNPGIHQGPEVRQTFGPE